MQILHRVCSRALLRENITNNTLYIWREIIILQIDVKDINKLY